MIKPVFTFSGSCTAVRESFELSSAGSQKPYEKLTQNETNITSRNEPPEENIETKTIIFGWLNIDDNDNKAMQKNSFHQKIVLKRIKLFSALTESIAFLAFHFARTFILSSIRCHVWSIVYGFGYSYFYKREKHVRINIFSLFFFDKIKGIKKEVKLEEEKGEKQNEKFSLCVLCHKKQHF